MSTPSSNGEQTPSKESDQASYEKWRLRLVKAGAIVGALAILWVIIYFMQILAIPVGIVLWTVVIVFVLGGLVDRLEARGLSRTVGTIIAYVIAIIVIALLCVAAFNPALGIGAQFQSLVDSLPTYIDQASAWFTELSNKYSNIIQNDTFQQAMKSLLSSLSDAMSSIAANSASGVVAAGSAIGNAFIAIGFAFVVAFWMLIELPNLEREFRRLMGERHTADVNLISATITRVLNGYIKGTVVQCLIIGIISGIFYAILGVQSPAAIGTITGVLNIIPIVGPWFGGAVAFITSAFTSPVTAVIALVGTIIIQQAVYTFVSPKIMGSAVDIHPALTFIALMAGSALGGAMSGMMGSLVGALISIPVVAAAKSIFVYYFEKNTGRRLAASDGVFFKADAPADAAPNPIADATGAAEMEKGRVQTVSMAAEALAQAKQLAEQRARGQQGKSPSGTPGAAPNDAPDEKK